MTNEELRYLFSAFRKPLVRDLISAGFPSSVSGAILNWFDPTKQEYLDHVNRWQVALCKGYCQLGDVPQALERLFVRFGENTLVFKPDAYFEVRHVHAVAKLFYKCDAPARQATDWDSVKSRLSSPPDLSIDSIDIRHLRRALVALDGPIEGTIGKYGPGITAEGFTPFDRWNRKGYIPPVPPSWYRVSPFDTWTPDGISYDFRTTKIAEVPKTLKSHRVVSSEPAQSMFAQLLLAKELDRRLHRAFQGHVFLHDTEMHNSLLYCDDMRTIDLSDASDHVSCDLIKAIVPNLWPLLASVRSTHALFPDGEVVELSTFAPMGSGICFPVLTLVNLAIGRVISGRRPYSVYGDDGIFHDSIVTQITEMQQACGLVVNHDKSCFNGLYRESCGLELYNGVNITPLYIRSTLSRCDASKLNKIFEKLEDLGWLNLSQEVAALVSASHPFTIRYNRNLQRGEMLVPVYIRRDRTSHVDGYAGIRKWLSTRYEGDRERESKVISSRGRYALVSRFRSQADYPYLWDALEGIRR